IGSIGLGWLLVSGRSRVPCPPAMTTAFMAGSSYRPLHKRPPGVDRVLGRGGVVGGDPDRVERPPAHPGCAVQPEVEVAPGDRRYPDHERHRGALADP